MTFFVISSYQHLIQNIFPKPQKKIKWSVLQNAQPLEQQNNYY